LQFLKCTYCGLGSISVRKSFYIIDLIFSNFFRNSTSLGIEEGVYTITGVKENSLAFSSRFALLGVRTLLAWRIAAMMGRISQEVVVRGLPGRTCAIVSHKVASVRHADRIIVLESGTIVEQGRHAERLARGGRYAGIHRPQTSALMADGPEADHPEAPRLDRRPSHPPAARFSPGPGHLKCWCRNSNVPCPLIVCGPTKNSMRHRSPMPSFASYRR
jgi:hypothetical protein